MEDEATYCKNCEHLLVKDDLFCSQCGQSTKDALTVKVLFSNTISNYFSVDARFFVSFIPLLFRPGFLPRKFIEGKRLTFLHPAQFYLFISIVFFFLLSIEATKQQNSFDKGVSSGFIVKDDVNLNNEQALDSTKQNGTHSISTENKIINIGFTDEELGLSNADDGNNSMFDKNRLDSLIAADAPTVEKLKVFGYKEGDASWKKMLYIQNLKIYNQKGGGLLKAFYDTIPISMFVLLPVFALLLKLLYRKKGAFAHNLVFSFYYFSFLFTVFSILLFANMIFKVPDWINSTVFIATWVYLLFAIMNFFGKRFFPSFFKTILVSFIYLIIIIPTSTVLLIIVSFLIY